MEMLKAWIRNLVLVILVAHFIELLLPSSKMQKYVKVVVGFFVILMILNPVLRLANQGLGQPSFNLIDNQKPSWEQIVEQGQKLKQENNQQAQQNYKQDLVRQITAVVKLNSNLEDIKTDVKLDQSNNLASVTIVGSEDRVEPIEVDLSSSQQESKPSPRVEHKVQEAIATLYNLTPDQVQVKLD